MQASRKGPPQAPGQHTGLRRIIKFGGAAITVKNQLETLRTDVLEACCDDVASGRGDQHAGSHPSDPLQPYRRSLHDGDTVVVHGAGSFGHFQASQFGVAHGFAAESREGFTQTRLSVTKLNQLVASALAAVGVPACGVSPCSEWRTSNRQVVAHGCGGVQQLLAAGLMPVLHGDAVLDEALGCTILSGDTVMAVLAKELRPQYAVFLTNVAGVYDRPPEEAGARRLTVIRVSQQGGWEAELEGGGEMLSHASLKVATAGHDTTGGIAKKVEEAAAIARLGIPVLIARAGSAAARAACALGPSAIDREDSAAAGEGGAVGGRFEGTLVVCA